ncbi:hypothetical protein F5887DRAFT_970864 [Amanita rubescens]|nr:hypothetical protein F5887DRAFT_970864 [Amanita rubescens]
MRLFASAVVLVSTICSWLVVNVVACEADIFKRTPPDRHHTRVLLPKPVNRTPEPCGLPTPVWMKMEVAKTVHSKNSEVRILKGNYMGNENPVLKVYRSQSDSEMKKEITTEVTNLKQVQHYIAGGFVRTAERKNDVYLLLKNMGVALDPENDKDRAKHEKLKESTRAEYKLKHGMVHMDPYIKNFAHDKDDDSHLKLVDWGCAQYEKVPEYEALEVFYWSLGLPRPPPPRAPIPRLVPVHRPPASVRT